MRKAIYWAVFAALLLTGCEKAKVPDLGKDYKEYIENYLKRIMMNL